MSTRRLALLIAVLTGLFVVGVALGVGGLLALGDPGVLVVGLVAALAALAAAALAWLAVRAVAAEEEPVQAETPPAVLPIATTPTRRPVRIQAMPVADLPPAYLAAVMKGLQASRRAGGAAERR